MRGLTDSPLSVSVLGIRREMRNLAAGRLMVGWGVAEVDRSGVMEALRGGGGAVVIWITVMVAASFWRAATVAG